MTGCCPNCSSTASLGGEVASVCTECATVTVAGAEFNLPLLLATTAGAVLLAFAWKIARRAKTRRAPRLAVR